MSGNLRLKIINLIASALPLTNVRCCRVEYLCGATTQYTRVSVRIGHVDTTYYMHMLLATLISPRNVIDSSIGIKVQLLYRRASDAEQLIATAQKAEKGE